MGDARAIPSGRITATGTVDSDAGAIASMTLVVGKDASSLIMRDGSATATILGEIYWMDGGGRGSTTVPRSYAIPIQYTALHATIAGTSASGTVSYVRNAFKA